MTTSEHAVRLEDDRFLGASIDGVRVEERVARGSLATVYRGTLEGRSVALKLYPPDAPTIAAAERARRERDAQRAVDHPSVARWIASGLARDGSPYLVSEWIEGARFEDRFGGRPQPWSSLRPILAALARGLRAIHAASIVHRDVKPSNVILPAQGEAAVLLDFGHALLLDEVRLTERGFTLGTPAYMSPEHVEGRALDGRADLYALGVVLYRGLTGTLPFDGPSPAVILDRQRCEPVQPPRERAPRAAIPDGAQDLAMWLLAKSPADRVPNAHVLLHTLQALEAREP
jgi:serine/threonine protein kinase, bacterial